MVYLAVFFEPVAYRGARGANGNVRPHQAGPSSVELPGLWFPLVTPDRPWAIFLKAPTGRILRASMFIRDALIPPNKSRQADGVRVEMM